MTSIEKKQELMRIKALRDRWLAEGELPYADGCGGQRFWDDYHDYLAPLPVCDLGAPEAQTLFEFDVQVFDSAERDVWWQGQCHFINGGTDVEIIEERYYNT